MLPLACIVEGHGEVKALPIVLRRVLAELQAASVFRILKPIRQPRDRLIKANELEKAIELASRDISRRGGILVVLDSEGEAPCQLGPRLLARAKAAAGQIPTRVVLANREWECWYLASIASLAGHRGLRPDAEAPENPEAIRGAKEWLARNMEPGKAYSETLDQPAFAALFDLDAARTLPSFSKFCRDVNGLLEDARQRFAQ